MGDMVTAETQKLIFDTLGMMVTARRAMEQEGAELWKLHGMKWAERYLSNTIFEWLPYIYWDIKKDAVEGGWLPGTDGDGEKDTADNGKPATFREILDNIAEIQRRMEAELSPTVPNANQIFRAAEARGTLFAHMDNMRRSALDDLDKALQELVWTYEQDPVSPDIQEETFAIQLLVQTLRDRLQTDTKKEIAKMHESINKRCGITTGDE